MILEPLPHVYPFRFADRTVERTGAASGRVRAVVTANARNVDNGSFLALTMAELIAQSALLLHGGDPEIGKSGFLAGLSDFQVTRQPEAGDELAVDVRMAAHLGPIVKFDGVILDQTGAEVARGSVTVKQGRAT